MPCKYRVYIYSFVRLKPLITASHLSLQFIPMPVLYGVFLYMGVASLSGIQVS